MRNLVETSREEREISDDDVKHVQRQFTIIFNTTLTNTFVGFLYILFSCSYSDNISFTCSVLYIISIVFKHIYFTLCKLMVGFCLCRF